VSPNLVDAGHHRRIERRDITGAAGTMRAVARAAARAAAGAVAREVAREAASFQQQSNVRKRRQKAVSIPVQYLSLPIGPEVRAFTPQPLISTTLGSICLICHGLKPIRASGDATTAKATSGPLFWLI
jgi:hypothetical protein